MEILDNEYIDLVIFVFINFRTRKRKNLKIFMKNFRVFSKCFRTRLTKFKRYIKKKRKSINNSNTRPYKKVPVSQEIII